MIKYIFILCLVINVVYSFSPAISNISPKSQAMNGGGSAILSTGEVIKINPANIVGESMCISMNYQLLNNDRYVSEISYIDKLYINYGVLFRLSGVNNIDMYDENGLLVEENRRYINYLLSVAANYSQDFGILGKLNAGIALNILHDNILGYRKTGLGTNFGCNYLSNNQNWRIAIVLRDLYFYYGSENDYINSMLNVEINYRFYTQDDRYIKVLGQNHWYDDKLNIIAGANISLRFDGYTKYYVAAEYYLLKSLSLIVGVSNSKHISGGFSYEIVKDFIIEYSYIDSNNDFGKNKQQISLKIKG